MSEIESPDPDELPTELNSAAVAIEEDTSLRPSKRARELHECEGHTCHYFGDTASLWLSHE